MLFINKIYVKIAVKFGNANLFQFFFFCGAVKLNMTVNGNCDRKTVRKYTLVLNLNLENKSISTEAKKINSIQSVILVSHSDTTEPLAFIFSQLKIRLVIYTRPWIILCNLKDNMQTSRGRYMAAFLYFNNMYEVAVV